MGEWVGGWVNEGGRGPVYLREGELWPPWAW